MAAYADADDMIARFDERTMKQLCSDDNTPVANLSGDPKMAAALGDATGSINAALQVGNQYTPSDLASLTSESSDYLKRLTCEIALSYLIRRRPEKYGSASKEIRENADAILEQFRQGVRVFDLDANLGAGLPTVDGPSAVDYQRLNLIRDRTRNTYPHRKSSLPLGR